MSSSEACSFVIMFGIAMLTIVRSSNVMKNPIETTTRITHGFARCFDCAAIAVTSVLPCVRAGMAVVRERALAHVPPAATLRHGTDIVLPLPPGCSRLVFPNPVRCRCAGAKYAPAMKLNGSAAIVSGGASGLGEATVRELAAGGSKVVIADLNTERGKALADELGG